MLIFHRTNCDLISIWKSINRTWRRNNVEGKCLSSETRNPPPPFPLSNPGYGPDYHNQHVQSGIIRTTPSMLKVGSPWPHPACSKWDHQKHIQHAQSGITMTISSMLKVGSPWSHPACTKWDHHDIQHAQSRITVITSSMLMLFNMNTSSMLKEEHNVHNTLLNESSLCSRPAPLYFTKEPERTGMAVEAP